MGINGINSFLKDEKVGCFFSIKLSKFCNMRFGIDALNWIYSRSGGVIKSLLDKKKDVLEELTQEEIYEGMIVCAINFNNKLLSHGITPVWIWDGVSRDSKEATKVSRKKARLKNLEKKDTLLNQINEMPILARDDTLLNEYRKVLGNVVKPSYDTINKLKEFIASTGIPNITAKDEAENLAASLAVEYKLSAVWSSDTDTYPLGAPIVVNSFSKKDNEVIIEGVFTLRILDNLGLTHDEFREFCIMIGTDFGDRIAGIGPKRAYELIKRYKNIDVIEKETRHNVSCLRHIESREQLTPYDTFIDVSELNVKPPTNLIKPNVKNHDYFNHIFNTFVHHLNNIGPAKNLKKIKKAKSI